MQPFFVRNELPATARSRMSFVAPSRTPALKFLQGIRTESEEFAEPGTPSLVWREFSSDLSESAC